MSQLTLAAAAVAVDVDVGASLAASEAPGLAPSAVWLMFVGPLPERERYPPLRHGNS